MSKMFHFFMRRYRPFILFLPVKSLYPSFFWNSLNLFAASRIREFDRRCGGWDSNPRSPKARDLESCASSLPQGFDLALPPPPRPRRAFVRIGVGALSYKPRC